MPKKKSPYVKGSPLDIVWRLHNKIIPDMEQLLRDKESVNEFNPNFRDCPLDTGAERMHIRAAKACADQIERDGFVDQNLWNKYSEAKEVDRMYLARPDGTTTYGVYNQATGEYVARSMMHVVALNYAAYLNGTSPEHATLREQNTLMERQLMDIERLKAALREVPRAPAEASEGSDDIPHPEARTYSVRSSGDGLFVIDCEYPDGKGHPIAGEMALYDAERIKQGNRIMRLEADAAGDRARCDAAEKETDALREALIELVSVTQGLGELEVPSVEDSAEVDHILSVGDYRRIAEAVAKAKTTLEDCPP